MRLLVHASLLTMLAVAPAVDAQILHGSFPLDGAQQVPPNPSLETGTGFMTLNSQTGLLSWDINWTATSVAAFLEVGDPGAAGDFIYLLSPGHVSTGSPSKGLTILSSTNAQALLDGKLYVNVLTDAFPDGEIRGQIHLQFEDLGGAFGQPEAVLTGGGTLTPGSTVSLDAFNLPVNQPGVAWLSFAPVPFPFFSGTVHAFPFNTQVLIATDATGDVNLASTWPVGIPSGLQATVQFLVADPTLSGGIALTNGVQLTTP